MRSPAPESFCAASKSTHTTDRSLTSNERSDDHAPDATAASSPPIVVFVAGVPLAVVHAGSSPPAKSSVKSTTGLELAPQAMRPASPATPAPPDACRSRSHVTPDPATDVAGHATTNVTGAAPHPLATP